MMSGFFSSSRRRYPNQYQGGRHYRRKGLFGMFGSMSSSNRGYGHVAYPQQGYPTQQYPHQSYPQQTHTVGGAQLSCGKCGASVPNGSKFCLSCGNPMGAQSVFCPNCGKPADPNARFCMECGSPIRR